MARITGLTAERMLEIEAQSIVAGAVDLNGNVTFTRYDGNTIDGGNIRGEIPAHTEEATPNTLVYRDSEGFSSFSKTSAISSNPLSLTDDSPPFMVGSNTGLNTAFDRYRLQCRYQGAGASFHINGLGGDVLIGKEDDSYITLRGDAEVRGLLSATLSIAEIGDAEDLDDYVTTGTFFQRSNSQAATGANYPRPYAGILQVFAPETGVDYMAWQTYREYDTYGLTWERRFYSSSGGWSAWHNTGGFNNDGELNLQRSGGDIRLWGDSNTVGRLILYSGQDVNSNPDSGIFQLGSVTGIHMVMDGNEIQVFDGSTPTTLNLNIEGGGVNVGVNGNGEFDVRTGAMFFTNYPTSSSSANVYMGSGGQFFRESSDENTKDYLEPAPADWADKILLAEPMTWFDKGQGEELASYWDAVAAGVPEEELPKIEPDLLERIPGFTIQQLESVGLDDFIQHDAEGNSVGLMYPRIPAAILMALKKEIATRVTENQALQDENQSLRDEIAAIKAFVGMPTEETSE